MRSRTWLACALLAAGALCGGCQRPAFLGGRSEPAGRPAVCEGRYALCLSAPCTPIPSFDGKTGKIVVAKALCECVVANGLSLGNLPCAARAPQDGRYLVSTYSFGETATHPTMTCPVGTPWAFCYDQPCTVDPKDPGKALCNCQVKTEGEYQTLGGGCDKAKCGTTLWSAATPAWVNEAGKLLAEGEGLKAVPANSCP
jgi:hypothetical protein